MALGILGSGARAVIAQERQKAPCSGAIQLQPMMSRFAQKGGIGTKDLACGSYATGVPCAVVRLSNHRFPEPTGLEKTFIELVLLLNGSKLENVLPFFRTYTL
jgi:hypothetical protein